MTPNQTKLVGLTMELELKTMEYKQLCEALDKLKKSNIDPNSPKLLKLKEKFEKNQKEITEINKQLKQIQEGD